MASGCPYLLRANEIERRVIDLSHPLNPASRVAGTRLGAALGLQRATISLNRVAPGAESDVYRAQHLQEEWLYVLSGCGVADIDDHEIAVAPGDFLAFPAPSVAHLLRNPFDYDLVYLVGGERRDCEVADFPRLGKRLVRTLDETTVYDLATGTPLQPRPDGRADVDPAVSG